MRKVIISIFAVLITLTPCVNAIKLVLFAIDATTEISWSVCLWKACVSVLHCWAGSSLTPKCYTSYK
jgi:hypothetical protein